MTLLNGSWYSRLCDPFVNYFTEKELSSLMLTAGYGYSVPRFTKSMFIQPYLTEYRIRGILSRNPKHDKLEKFTELENYVRELGLFPEPFSLIKPVMRHLRQITSIEKYFKKILMKTKPKVVFVTSYYSTESMAMILACHRMGIPSVDIQHGFQGDFHTAYGQWNCIPEKGYELLPRIFWCWSELEASAIRKWSKRCNGFHQPIVGGNLFLQRWIIGEDDVVKVYDKVMDELKRDYKERIQILYTLNGCTKNEMKSMVEIISGINNSSLHSYFWVRLHPVAIDQKTFVKEILSEHGISNFELDNASDLPLYAVLRHMDIHITECSSVVIEAESFYVPSILVGQNGVESFSAQFSSGWATQSHTVGGIIREIQLKLQFKALFKENKYNSIIERDKAFDYLLNLILPRSPKVQ